MELAPRGRFTRLSTLAPRPGPRKHRYGHHDRARQAMALHPARGVDGVAPQVVDELAPADDAGHHGSGVHADPEPQAVRAGPTTLALAQHRQRHLRDGLAIVTRNRYAAGHHVSVADRLDLLQSVLVGQPVEGGEDAVEESHHLFRRQCRRQRREADGARRGEPPSDHCRANGSQLDGTERDEAPGSANHASEPADTTRYTSGISAATGSPGRRPERLRWET
nr:hypothetical protein [Jiangella muralis]